MTSLYASVDISSLIFSCFTSVACGYMTSEISTHANHLGGYGLSKETLKKAVTPHTFLSSVTTCYYLAIWSFPALHYKSPDVKVFEVHCLLSLVRAYPLITGTSEIFQCDKNAKTQFTTQFASRTVRAVIAENAAYNVA